jgi:hypothetical protein
VKVSACIDCDTSIIGERLRCPACHDRHASAIVDEVIAQPREASAIRILLGWLVMAEMIAVVIAGIAIVLRGC